MDSQGDIMMSQQPSSSLATSSSSAHYVTVTDDNDDEAGATNSLSDVVLTVMTTSGHEQHIKVSKDITARKLKQLCIPKYIEEKRLADFAASGVPGACGGVGAPGVSDEDDESRFKLVHTKTGKCLVDYRSLSDQNVVHSDSVLLLPRKTKPPQFFTLKAIDGASRPMPTTIQEITQSLPYKNQFRNPKKDSNFNNYLTEMRKIILSLIYVSHRLLCYNKEAVDMFREALVLLRANRASDEQSVGITVRNGRTSFSGSATSTGDRSSNSSADSGSQTQNVNEIPVDSQLVKQLTDMGFKPSLSKLALILNDMSVSMATEWLLANGDEDYDEQTALAQSQLPHSTSTQSMATPSASATPCSTEETTDNTLASTEEEPMDVDDHGDHFPTASSSSNNGKKSMFSSQNHDAFSPNEGLKVLQEFHELSFQPDPKALRSLFDMGFPRNESYDALRINGNHENFACEWLLNMPRRPTIEEWERGIDPNSSMYKAIVANPLVQLLLNNPKTLLALEDILGHPNSMSHYLNDPDAGPLLVQISSIYSTERHADSSSGNGNGSGSSASNEVVTEMDNMSQSQTAEVSSTFVTPNMTTANVTQDSTLI